MMKKVLLALIAVCMLSVAAAQVSSPTKDCTAKTMTSEVDDVLSVTDWSTVDVKNGMLFMDIIASGFPVVGGAKLTESGIFFSGYLDFNFYSDSNTTYLTNGDAAEVSGRSNPDLSGALLVGFNASTPWGIKATFDIDHRILTTDTVYTDPATTDEETTGDTSLTFSAGTSLALNGGILKPSFTFGYSKKLDEESDDNYDADDTDHNYDHGYSTLLFSAGADYIMAQEGDHQHQFGGTISVKTRSYCDNDYYKTFTIPTSVTEGTTFTLVPYYTFVYKPSANIVFDAKTTLSFSTFSSQIKKKEYSKTNLDLFENLGASYKVSDRLSVNGGTEVSFKMSTEKEKDDSHTTNKETKFGTNFGSSNGNAFDTSTWIGFSFKFNENFNADVRLSSSPEFLISYKF